MLCPNCKSDIPADFNYCPNCGTKILLDPDQNTLNHLTNNRSIPEHNLTDTSSNHITENNLQFAEDLNKGKSGNRKSHAAQMLSLLGSIALIVIIFLLYQNFFKSNLPEYPKNPHEFTSELIASLDSYELGEISTMRSKKLDGKWVIVTGVHSFNASDDSTMMLPASATGSSLISQIYYYSDKDFASAYLALPLDETTILGRCSYKDGKYSIVDAILLTNDTHQPLVSTNSNSQEPYSDEDTDNTYDASITGDELILAAEKNMARIINMYAGKRVKISNLEITYINPNSAYFDDIQSIYFRDSRDLQSINKGDKITVIGYIIEELGTYCISNAVLVSDTDSVDSSDSFPPDNNESDTSENQTASNPYEVGKQAAQKVYNTIFQYGYDCEKVAIISNSEDPAASAMADGFYDEAVLTIGYTPYDVSVYAPGITDYTVFLTRWKEQGISGVYIPFTSQSEFDFVFPILASQAEASMCDIYFFDAEGHDIT